MSVLVLIGYGGLLYLTYYGFMNTPAGFIPSQDMGYLLVNAQSPDATSAERNKATLDKVEQITRKTPGVKFTQLIAGQSMLLAPGLELRLDVRDPRRVLEAARGRSCTARRSPRACGSSSPPRSPRRR